MSAEKVPYPELDCALAMSKARGNLNFLVNRIKEEWHETHTTAQAVQDAHSALVEAQPGLFISSYRLVLFVMITIERGLDF